MTAWIIDQDIIPGGGDLKSDVGVSGPRGYKGDGSELKHKFRMKDDDGQIYYYGRCSEVDDFAPLDDFGGPNAGCTSIEYLHGRKWVAL